MCDKNNRNNEPKVGIKLLLIYVLPLSLVLTSAKIDLIFASLLSWLW